MSDPLNGDLWRVHQEDCLTWLASLPAQSCDLVFGSPPYVGARLYLENGKDLGIARNAEEWSAWMVDVVKASLRVCRGLVAFVVEGQTEDYRYDAAPLLLMADLHRAGVHLRKPPIYRRVGIPGSGGSKKQHADQGGGADWLRNDTEWIICATNGGKLPWADATVMGHKPKWGPGGEMSHRLSDGTRVNQWGKTGTESTMSGAARKSNGQRQKSNRPSHVRMTKSGATSGYRNGDTLNEGVYVPPVLANPGNVIECTQSESEVISFLSEYGDVTCKRPSEILRMLQQAVRAKTLPLWLLGVAEVVRGAAILRPEMHGGSEVQAPREKEGRGAGAIPGAEAIFGGPVRQVRHDSESDSTPRRRESDQQSGGECRDPLSGLPCDRTPDTEKSSLSHLWREEPFRRAVREALLPIQEAWRSAEEMSQQSLRDRGISSDLIHCKAGGGQMGSNLCHANEAPFPEKLAEFFVRSFAPENGIVIDPFSGSGTTAAVAVRWGRRALCCDLRQSQVELSRRRIKEAEPGLFTQRAEGE